MGLWDLAQRLRRRQARFFDRLERQAKIASDAAECLAQLGTGVPAADVRQRIERHEQESQGLVRELEAALSRAHITPIDREDIYALALEVDDVVDLVHRVAWRCELMEVSAATPTMSAMIAVLVKSTATVASAMELLRRRDYAGLLAAKDRVATLATEGAEVYRVAVRGIFARDGADMTILLRERQVLDDLDAALEHCAVVMQTLATVAVKHR